MKFNDYFLKSLDDIEISNVSKAMKYSLFSNGKMLRSKLMIEIGKSYNLNEEVIYPFATALEFIHTYSLIHDDLPAMDNDDLRRGRNTCHIEFDEATAILAGDALLTHAFKLLTKSDINPELIVKIVAYFSEFAGANGMIYGQDLDMNKTINNVDDLIETHKHKTGKLFALSFIIPGVIAKEDNLELLENAGIN